MGHHNRITYCISNHLDMNANAPHKWNKVPIFCISLEAIITDTYGCHRGQRDIS